MKSNDKGLRTLFPILAMAMNPAKYPDSKTPKARYGAHGVSIGKTRPGCIHKVGTPFRPRFITSVRLSDGSTIHPTPALYRRLHLGDQKKVEAMNGS